MDKEQLDQYIQIRNQLENIDKKTLLIINGILMPHTWIILYPKWLQEILSYWLAKKTNKQYNKIQQEIQKLNLIINNNNG